MPTIDPSKHRYLRALRGRGNLTAAETHELEMADAAYGPDWWMIDKERRWREHASAVGAFLTENGRWPSTGGTDHAERKLGTWLAACRNAAKQGVTTMTWTADRSKYLDKLAPGWRETPPATGSQTRNPSATSTALTDDGHEQRRRTNMRERSAAGWRTTAAHPKKQHPTSGGPLNASSTSTRLHPAGAANTQNAAGRTAPTNSNGSEPKPDGGRQRSQTTHSNSVSTPG